MAYKRISPMPVVEGGTGAQTLTGVLIGNGTSAVTGNAVTQYDVLVGGASNAISSVAPSATSGVPLISGGSSANPSFGTAVVAGGGTGATTLTGVLIGNGTSAVTGNAITQHDVLVGGASNAISSVAPSATSGVPFVSAGSSSNPAFGIAVVAGGGTGVATMTTAYAPVCAGTTATGALQVASTGLSTSGYVLTSNGASSLPSFQAAAGGVSTIDGDSGSVTGSTITITGGSSGAVFTGSGTTLTESFNYLALPASTSTNGQVTINGNNVLWSPGASTNIFVGGSGNSSISGNQNICVGSGALPALTSGSDNVVLGYQAGANLQGGAGNVMMGIYAGHGLVSGNKNLCLGTTAGNNLAGSESYNVYLNNIGNSGENNYCRIGSGTGTGDRQLNATFISGIQGITVTGTAVLVSSSDQLGIAVSSIRFKENVVDMADASSDIMKLRPVMFNYKGDPANVNPGLIAEEVNEVMPSLVVYEKDGQPLTVKYHDLPSLLLNELQKAVKRIEVLEAKLLNQN